MEFPKYKSDTTFVDILNFDTWQGVLNIRPIDLHYKF